MKQEYTDCRRVGAGLSSTPVLCWLPITLLSSQLLSTKMCFGPVPQTPIWFVLNACSIASWCGWQVERRAGVLTWSNIRCLSTSNVIDHGLLSPATTNLYALYLPQWAGLRQSVSFPTRGSCHTGMFHLPPGVSRCLLKRLPENSNQLTSVCPDEHFLTNLL